LNPAGGPSWLWPARQGHVQGHLAGANDDALSALKAGAAAPAGAAQLAHPDPSHGLTAEESAPVVQALRKRPEAWRDFMLRFELGLEQPDPARARTSAFVIRGLAAAAAILIARAVS
jgi:hypothetical protein